MGGQGVVLEGGASTGIHWAGVRRQVTATSQRKVGSPPPLFSPNLNNIEHHHHH
jgi:hypothetical protein